MWPLEYPLTHPLRLGRLSIVLIMAGTLLFTAIITIINIVTVGYELMPVTSNTFNITTTFWYEKLVPTKWKPNAGTCDAATIKLREGTCPYIKTKEKMLL